MAKMKLVTMSRKAPGILLVLGATVGVVRYEISSPLLYQTLRGKSLHVAKIFIPRSLDTDSRRRLANSLNLGGGACQWQPPAYEVPKDLDFYKTFIAGFPSGDKRMAYLQMEALAGFSTKDEWDFENSGISNHPFIKGNYPHHEGIWGWGTAADQTVLMVPNIRRSMVEYHDILWDLGYATSWEDATLLSDKLYEQRPLIDDYYEWRDSRVLDEVHWYGWFIDYWMEGGLLRDIFTHRLTSLDHWNDLMLKPFYTREQLDYDHYVEPGTVVTPTYDPHCENGDITDGCEPVEVISADRLRDYTKGAAETTKIATALMSNDKTGHYVIASEAWDCIWKELIQNGKGPIKPDDRPGYNRIYQDYNFSAEMLLAMIDELNRLITKYSGADWNTKTTANDLVEVLEEHLVLVEAEIEEINTGVRILKTTDFLGADERARMRGLASQKTTKGDPDEKDHSRYFIALEQKRYENKRQQLEQATSTGKKNGKSNGKSLDADFMKAISDALSNIRTLESAGGMDQATASELADRVRKVANVVFPEGS